MTGYRISGAKQWISNGGVADLYTILALAPGGPSWFVVEAGAEGFTHGKPEDKHGIRLEQHGGAVPGRASTSAPTSWSAAWRARGWSRPSRCSATRG